jgi:hypothetical protein
MAIKPATIEAEFGWGRSKPHVVIFAQHYTTKWQPDHAIKSETTWYEFGFDSKEKLLEALLNPEGMLKKAKEYLIPETAARTFKNLVAGKFVIGFNQKNGYTVDALDKRHLKLLVKTPEAGLYPQEPDVEPAK